MDLVVVEGAGTVPVVGGAVTVVEVEETIELGVGVVVEGAVVSPEPEHATKHAPNIATTAAAFKTPTSPDERTPPH